MSNGQVYWVTVGSDSSKALEILKSRKEVQEVVPSDGQLKVTFGNDVDPAFLAEALVQGGVRIKGLWEDELGLEEVFLRVTRGETQ
jgi:hypothetical protein